MKLKDILSEAINESWTVKDGNVLSNGKLIGYYDFDRDSDSFWVDDVKKGKGQLSFETKKEVEDYFKKNEKDAVKHLQKLRESTNPSDIIKDLDKVRTDLIKKVDVLIAKKKKLYSDVDITTPMSADEKKLDKDIQDIFSQIQQIIQQKRKIKNESMNESTTKKDIEKLTSYKDLFKFFKDNKSKLNKKYTDDIEGEIGALKYLESDYKRGDADREEVLVAIEEIQDLIKKSLDIKESVNEGKYYIGYNKGRGQGTGVFKDVFSTYKDAKKELEKIEKQRGGSYHQIAYYVADEKGNFVREAMLGEGRGIKSIQNDLDKTVVAIESEIASYKATKGTPQEKKHIDNLKKLHPIKKKLQSELDMAVSGLYRDAELKIED